MNLRDLALCVCLVGLGALWWQSEQRAKRVDSQLALLVERSAQPVRQQSVGKDELNALVYAALEQRQRQEHTRERDRLFDGFKAARAQLDGGHRVYGDPGATVSLYEFSDFECPYCKQFHGIPKEIVDSSAGQVNWVFKHFPLDIHNPTAANEAVAAECVGEVAGNRAFWVFADLLFKATGGNGSGAPDGVSPIIARMGVDQAEFDACVRREDAYDVVRSQFSAGQRAGVSQTPTTIVVNNKTGATVVVPGADGQRVLTAIANVIGAE